MYSLIQQMITAALEAANPANAVKNFLSENPIESGDLYLLAVGKAAVPMAEGALTILDDRILNGVIISKTGSASFDGRFQMVQGGHPIPDAHSLEATQAAKQMLQQTGPGDQILCLVSGGTSSLLTDPILSLAHWRALNDALLRCGCPIDEVNTVRQFFDRVKGGGLLKWAENASWKTLILSDVIGNPLSLIGSGPTVPSPTDGQKIRQIFSQFKVWEYLDDDLKLIIQSLIKEHIPAPHNYPITNTHFIIGDIRQSADAAAAVSEAHGYQTQVVSTKLTGEAQEVGIALARSGRALPRGHCWVYGGETTVTLSGASPGKGGRNQELALAAAIELEGQADVWVASFATDGEDGPNPGAGAIVNGRTLSQARNLGLDAAEYLKQHDSFTFFASLKEGHLKPGSTGTNVNDLSIVLKE